MKSAIIAVTALLGFFIVLTTRIPGAPADEGAALYEKHCFKCHGAEGKGDGPATKLIKLKVGNLSDKSAMEGYSDDMLFKWISEGGEAVGKSKLMRPYKEQMKPDQIKCLIDFVKTLQE